MSHLKDQMLPSGSALQHSHQALQEIERKSMLEGGWWLFRRLRSRNEEWHGQSNTKMKGSMITKREEIEKAGMCREEGGEVAHPLHCRE